MANLITRIELEAKCGQIEVIPIAQASLWRFYFCCLQITHTLQKIFANRFSLQTIKIEKTILLKESLLLCDFEI